MYRIILRSSVLLLLFQSCTLFPVKIPFIPSVMSEEQWAWDDITSSTIEDFDNIAKHFPDEFFWGPGTSDIQMNGRRIHKSTDIPHSSKWTLYNKLKEFDAINPEYNGIDNPEEYVQALKDAGLNSYRFSIESSKVMPEQGKFDENAMAFYKELRYVLLEAGITPIYTLYHHDEPEDFYLNGSFENDENIDHFVDFATYVFHQFAQDERVAEDNQIWITFNEPVGYALGAYVDGRYPPAKKLKIWTCGNVVKNMIKTHCGIVDAFHQANTDYEYNFNLSFGIAKVFNPIQPYTWYNPGDQLAARIFNYLLHEPFMNFFKTGKFSWLGLVSYHDEDAPSKLDFIGVNYYTHTLLSNFKQRNREHEITADKHNSKKAAKSMYAEGFDWSLNYAAKLNKPIMVTELGFATSDNDKRTEFIKRHMHVLAKNLKNGLPITGCIWWTLMNNSYEWCRGNSSKHGLFDYNDGAIIPSESAQAYFDVVAAWNAQHTTI